MDIAESALQGTHCHAVKLARFAHEAPEIETALYGILCNLWRTFVETIAWDWPVDF